ncbi:hypothetical protein [Knoellia sp. p5-6-4]|uniref:hypothetical protein n=1 Tax=unclassified Knoellia TaxID=2618719 RepID=UPI0023DA5ECC|nr:hypothetical protein [Knoellia sp. p5-6-4]MDF2143447.1 hypothetical protein [Knoellia sp. p5-6-4]
MGFLDRLLGREPRTQQPPYAPPPPDHSVPDGGLRPAAGPDERAVARYRYLLRTAPPEALEQVHAEAFARLTPEQRSQVLAELSRDLPAGERPPGADPQSLARSATRAELRRPGYLEHAFSRGRFGGSAGGTGMGMGGSIVGSMMGTIAGVVIGSALADALFDGYADSPEAAEAGDTGGADTGTADTSTSDTGSAEAGGADYAGGDFGGGGFGDFGGDFGGGDF